MKGGKKKPYREIRVELPTWVVIALRMTVKDANEKVRMPEMRWTVSLLLEEWLMKAFSTEELDAFAKRSAEFKQAAEAWLRWTAGKEK